MWDFVAVNSRYFGAVTARWRRNLVAIMWQFSGKLGMMAWKFAWQLNIWRLNFSFCFAGCFVVIGGLGNFVCYKRLQAKFALICWCGGGEI